MLWVTNEHQYNKRLSIWNVLLPYSSSEQIFYEDLKQQAYEHPELIDKDMDVIKMDVDRSFTRILRHTVYRE